MCKTSFDLSDTYCCISTAISRLEKVGISFPDHSSSQWSTNGPAVQNEFAHCRAPIQDCTLQDHYELMPWAAIPFGEYQARRRLKADFIGLTLPWLVILDSQGRIVNADACKRVVEDPQGLDFPWPQKSCSW